MMKDSGALSRYPCSAPSPLRGYRPFGGYRGYVVWTSGDTHSPPPAAAPIVLHDERSYWEQLNDQFREAQRQGDFFVGGAA